MAEKCRCGRPRYTAEDLRRWNAELVAGGDPNPEWARSICWTKSEYAANCLMKPLSKESTDE
jgi:hypothetical protein